LHSSASLSRTSPAAVAGDETQDKSVLSTDLWTWARVLCRETSRPSPSTTVVQWATIHFVVGLRPLPMAVARSGGNERLTAYSELPVGIFVSRARIFCRDERIYRRCAAFSRSPSPWTARMGHPSPPLLSSLLHLPTLLLGARRGRTSSSSPASSPRRHVSCSTGRTMTRGSSPDAGHQQAAGSAAVNHDFTKG
jgi:hypothetical protein